MPGNPLVTTAHTPQDQLSRLEARLDNLQDSLDRLLFVLERQAQSTDDTDPDAATELQAICNTTVGPGGQVVPGTLIIYGTEAKLYFESLGKASVVPLTHLPPWTHMALADQTWWLLQMH